MPAPDPSRPRERTPGDDDFDLARLPANRFTLLKHLPEEIRKLGATLVEQELWCLGGDVRQHPHNLLKDYGFTREPSQPGVVGSTAYRLEGDGSELALWGWGLGYAEKGVGAIFVRRHDFNPLRLSIDTMPHVNHPSGLEPFLVRSASPDQVAGLRLLGGLCEKLEAYERWVVETKGEPYRAQRVFQRHTHGAVVVPEAMVRGWQLLGEHVSFLHRARSTGTTDPWRSEPLRG